MASRTGITALQRRQADDHQHLDDLGAPMTRRHVAGHAAHTAGAALLALPAPPPTRRLARDEASGRAEVLNTIHTHAVRLERIERTERVLLTMRWLDHLPVDDETTVSVVLPTRNRAQRLPGAIASVQAQTHRRWELVVVDDGSTDDTARCSTGSTTTGSRWSPARPVACQPLATRGWTT
ncbi:MAG: glycosyltransferase [Acidimicrobiales bacterium]